MNKVWKSLLRTVKRLIIAVVLSVLSELYVLMKDQDNGVKEMKLEKDKRLFNHCFMGEIYIS